MGFEKWLAAAVPGAAAPETRRFGCEERPTERRCSKPGGRETGEEAGMLGAESGAATEEEGSEADGRRSEGASRGDSEGFFGVCGGDGNDGDRNSTWASGMGTEAPGS